AKAQAEIPVIEASEAQATIADGKYVELAWKLDSALNPDTYYVNIPSKPGRIRFSTDRGRLTFRTQPGKHYDFVVVLNGTDSCHVRIASVHPPTAAAMQTAPTFPHTIRSR